MMTAAGMSLDPARTAVVVIDVQNDYCEPAGVFAQAGLRVEGLAELVGRINVLVAAARAAGSPVVWVRMEWPDDASVGILAERSPFLRSAGLRGGTWGAELVEGLDVEPGDVQVTKPRFSGFYETELEETLRGLGVTTLVTAGVRTDFCVESTVRDAFFRDFDVVVAEDAVAGYFAELHDNSLRLMQTVFARVAPVDRVAAALGQG
jgi:ureidoacrylate peracid hydrolase